ncbi:hypothetical protein C8R47DRAFT_1224926 [Mycena vitilis]|nr:hypothetical protein C8R47DRAFT_1224926 [Mycena vitilis]
MLYYVFWPQPGSVQCARNVAWCRDATRRIKRVASGNYYSRNAWRDSYDPKKPNHSKGSHAEKIQLRRSCRTPDVDCVDGAPGRVQGDKAQGRVAPFVMLLVQSSEENNCRAVVIWRQNLFEAAASASQEKVFKIIGWPVSQFGSHLFGHNTPLHRGEPYHNLHYSYRFLSKAPLSPRQLMPVQVLPAYLACTHDVCCQLYQDGRFKIPHTDGEVVERAWAEKGPLAGRRHDYLDIPARAKL